MLIRPWYLFCGLVLCVVACASTAAQPARAQSDPSLPPAAPIQVHFLNAGNGDAAWVGLPDGSTAVIDCGPPEFGKQLLLGLQTADIATIDLLAPSRATPDIMGGCADVVRYLNVHNVLWSPPTSPSSTARALDATLSSAGINRLPGIAGWTQDYGAARLTLFNPPQTPTGNPADDSQVLLLEYGASAVLFSGGIHQVGEQQVQAAALPGRSVTVLRAADHGVTGTSSLDFLRSLFPSIGPKAVILSYSAARGAPQLADEVAERLAALHGAVLSTARNGSITVTLGFDGTATWSTER